MYLINKIQKLYKVNVLFKDLKLLFDNYLILLLKMRWGNPAQGVNVPLFMYFLSNCETSIW